MNFKKTEIMQWKYLYKMRHHHQVFQFIFMMFNRIVSFSPVSSNICYLLWGISHIWVPASKWRHWYLSTCQLWQNTISMFFDVLFRFMQPILLDATAWVHMSEQFCVYFVAWKFFLLFKHLDGPKRLKSKEWNKWNITTKKKSKKNWCFQKCINSFIVLTFWNRKRSSEWIDLPTWGAKWGFVNFFNAAVSITSHHFNCGKNLMCYILCLLFLRNYIINDNYAVFLYERIKSI